MRARNIVAGLLAFALVMSTAAPAMAAPVFDPLKVIPDDTFRASTSFSQADIQAFLNTQSGPLKSLNTTDYVLPGVRAGKHKNEGILWTWTTRSKYPKKTAAQIIYEACQAWSINPRVMLATLQKEQSLLTTSNSANAVRLIKAVGCGVYDNNHDNKIENLYPGFGNQIWNGARSLSQYELPASSSTSGQLSGGWKPGTVMSRINGAPNSGKIVPKNASTFALYTYTPYYPQNLVWDVYVRYFGDPATSPRLRPVYRFQNRRTGGYYYTASEAKRYGLLSSTSGYRYDGVAFTSDTSATPTAQLWALHNARSGAYYYTPSTASRDSLLKDRAWHSEGGLCGVTWSHAATPVYRLDNKKTHARLLTSSATLKKTLTSGRTAAFSYMGVAFYVPIYTPPTTPVAPAHH
jgi:hypothetical protein